MGFVNRLDQNLSKYWYANEKMMVVPACLNGRCCHSGCVGLYRIKDKDDESLPLLAFLRQIVNVILLKYSMEGRLSSSHLGFRSIPSDVCYDDTKQYQVRSEHRRIQNTFKHRRGSAFAYTVNSLKSLTGYTKTLHLICLKGFCTPLLIASVRCRKITLNAAT